MPELAIVYTIKRDQSKTLSHVLLTVSCQSFIFNATGETICRWRHLCSGHLSVHIYTWFPGIRSSKRTYPTVKMFQTHVYRTLRGPE